jgi:hypothetical protein
MSFAHVLEGKMNYDIIGDIHGHADRLEALLKRLGYANRGGAWRHPERQALFVGDLIDRGPDQLRSVRLVRAMTDAGSARATMGNHEFNAIAWATSDPDHEGRHLRPRHGAKGEKNRKQHQRFLEEVGPDSADHREWIRWFFDLPLWIREPGFQVIHACWSPHQVALARPHLRDGERITPEFVEAASREGSELHGVVETLLKGVEVVLPPGSAFTDKDGHVRHNIRTRWWNGALTTYRDAYMGPPGIDIPDIPIVDYEPIPEPDRPTFIGHYWFPADEPVGPAALRVGCVDYSVANNGPLVAYRFDGEATLSADKFVAV